MNIIIKLLIFFLAIELQAQIFKVDTLYWNGNIDKRINIVILGDGYKESELSQFNTHSKSFMETFFAVEPFANYRLYYNVFTIKVPSNESGAALSPDNLIDNYFGSTFGWGGIDRLLVVTKTSKVMNILAANFPDYDQIIMLVNSTKYGGSGGWIATSSVHPSAGEIVLHEVGHSFAGLADEYWAGPQYALEKPNMTKQSEPDKVKWKNWYGDFDIGIYPYGSQPPESSWFRPHNACKMRGLSWEFCSVCTETIIAKIHSLTSPINSFTPDTTILEGEDFPLDFRLDLLKPVSKTIKTEWYLNSKILEINSDSIRLFRDNLPAGFNQLQTIIKDTTPKIRIDNYDIINAHYLNWVIDNNLSSVPINLDGIKTNLAISPNPASDYIEISKTSENLKSSEFLNIKIYNTLGECVMSVDKQLAVSLQRINISHLPIGVYYLNIGNYTEKFVIWR